MLTVAITAGAFACGTVSGTARAAGVTPIRPSSIRPGYPFRPAGGRSGRPTFATRLTTNSIISATSSNWAGYAAMYGTTTFRLVSAHFTAPYLDCKGVTVSSGAWSSHWVGLDGLRVDSTTVEQAGVDAVCDGTSPICDAWWEMFPQATHITSLAVHPGNAINMSVTYSTSTHSFTLTLSDTTTGQKVSHTASCPYDPAVPEEHFPRLLDAGERGLIPPGHPVRSARGDIVTKRIRTRGDSLPDNGWGYISYPPRPRSLSGKERTRCASSPAPARSGLRTRNPGHLADHGDRRVKRHGGGSANVALQGGAFSTY